MDVSGLDAAINQAGQAVLITDRGGKIVYVNAAFTSITGYSFEEAIGRHPHILKSSKQDPGFYKELWQTISAGHNWHGELINRRKDGTLYTEEMTIAPVRDSEGAIVRYIALKQDVTERRRSEAAQRLLATIVESSDDAIIGGGLDGTISSWNKGAEAIYGYRADEAIGKPISTLVPPDRWGEIQRTVDGVTGGEGLRQFETVRITKDGHHIDVSISVSPMRDAAGKIVGVATITRDISERRRRERAVRESSERFQALFERSLDSILVLDFDGAVLDINPAMLNLLGYDPQDIGSLHISSLLGSDELPRASQALRKIELTGPYRETSEYRLRCKAGTFINVETSSTVIPLEGSRRGVLCVARDVTGRKRAEDALRESEEKFRQLTENIREVFWMINANGSEILYLSPAYETIWGRSRESCYQSPMSWMEAIEPEDRERAHALFVRPLAGEQIRSEYRNSNAWR